MKRTLKPCGNNKLTFFFIQPRMWGAHRLCTMHKRIHTRTHSQFKLSKYNYGQLSRSFDKWCDGGSSESIPTSAAGAVAAATTTTSSTMTTARFILCIVQQVRNWTESESVAWQRHFFFRFLPFEQHTPHIHLQTITHELRRPTHSFYSPVVFTLYFFNYCS